MQRYHITIVFSISLVMHLVSGRLNIDLPASILGKTKAGKPTGVSVAKRNKLPTGVSVEQLVVKRNCVADPLPTDLFTKNGGSAAFGGPQNVKDGSIRFSGNRFVILPLALISLCCDVF